MRHSPSWGLVLAPAMWRIHETYAIRGFVKFTRYGLLSIWAPKQPSRSCRGAVRRCYPLRYAGVTRLGTRRRTRARVAFVMLGFALLVTAWIGGTQPFGAPDEASHYVRALTITNGHILGRKGDYTAPVSLTPAQRAWANRDTRAVAVPARLRPPNMSCIDGKRILSGSCLVQTVSGNYPPLPFVLPAAGLAVAHDTSTAIWVVRAASALPSVVFLLLAVALLWDGTGWSLLGLFVAVSPMVLWVSSILNPSGMQITACLAFAAAAIRIARAPAEAPPWTWLSFAVSGAAAILAGPIGLEFVLLELALFAALLGRPGLRKMRSARGRPLLLVAAVALVAAGVVALIYTRIAGFAATFRISPIGHGLHEGLLQLSPVLRGAVGIFGALTVFLPLAANWIWWLVVLGLVAAAIWLGNRRERMVIGGVVVVALAFPVLFYAWIDRFTGFGLQAREVLPPLMLIPLVTGEVVNRHRFQVAQRRWAQPALGGAIALIAAFQAYAWWYDARIVAGAPSTIRFYAYAKWTPPGGWLPWIGFAVFGTAAMLVFASTEWLRGFTPHAVRSAVSRSRPEERLPARR
jgi:Predicted membrane protein (DUF2142)